MLEQLFGSKTRVRILRLFLNNPSQPYYLRELTRKLKSQLNSVRREINNLGKMGIIKSVKPAEDKEAKEEAEERAMERLMKAGISKRDAEICIEKAIRKTPSGEIGKMYDLKKRRINQIIKEVQEKLAKLKSRKE